MEFKERFNTWGNRINKSLEEYIPKKETPEKNIYDAMRYSLLAGGKRLRPILALAVCDVLSGDMDEVMPYACAVEMIHTYSLIHDDLPSMDNDDYRRGRLTCHKVYGESIAILAGDSLLNSAFELMLKSTSKKETNVNEKIKAIYVISKASGTSGMIGGQVVDIESEGKNISKDLLTYMHKCKTGALIKAPIIASAIICKANRSEIDCLELYAENIGLAFQIKDDILDVEGSLEVMGKKSGSDVEKNKSTFITLYGMDESKRMLSEIIEKAISSIEGLGERAWFLKKLACYLIEREN